MITVGYCQTMARYNAWQNRSVSACMKALDDTALRQDRGAFFGSIWKTANHLLWGDQLWMSRFDGGHGPSTGIAESVDLHDDTQLFLDDRLRCVVHFFNHQTHHRGQMHAMLTAAGQRRWSCAGRMRAV